MNRLTIAAIAALLLLGIGVALSQSITTTSDVQIVARKLEDGRIEFGLEQDGERILPRVRFFPTTAPVDRWLKSSEIAVDTGEESVAEPPAPTSDADDDQVEYGTEAFDILYDGRVVYGHTDAGIHGQRTLLTIYGTTSDSLYDEAKLSFYCDHDVQSLWISVDAGVFIGGEWNAAGLNDYDGITSAAFGTIAEQEWRQRGFVTYDDEAQNSGSTATAFFINALTERWASVSLPRYSSSITANFDLQGAFDTPVQWLLMGCNRITGH